MPKIESMKPKPKLVNRGPAGLLTKLPKPESARTEGTIPKDGIGSGAINKIAPALKEMIVSISSVQPDPNNARLHPERNLEAIQKSLDTYGQVKPLVVRKANGVVVAGNGTLEAALRLGWTEIAVSRVEMSEVEATGYGLADNRTAELAKWDFEVVARLDRLLLEAGHEQIGWSVDELEVLRAADWVPPPLNEDEGSNGFGGGGGSEEDNELLVGFTPEEHEVIREAVIKVREEIGAEVTQAKCLVTICEKWLGR